MQKKLLILFLASAVLAGRCNRPNELLSPTAPLVLSLDGEEGNGCGRRRFQHRRIRSVGVGSLTVKYQTGMREDGVRVRPGSLDAVIAPGAAFAYDVVEEVVRLRYLDLKQREEIRTELAAKGVSISAGSVSNLSRQGLAGLEHLHMEHAPALAEHYRRKAFVLQMDGTREGGDWAHFVMREGFSGHILLSEKIRSEHSADIEKMLWRLKRRFGTPDSIISDMSSPICCGIKPVFPEVPHHLCHYHFLNVVGKAMLDEDHERLGCSNRQTSKVLGGIRCRLTGLLRENHELARSVIDIVDHILHNSADLKAEGFPFDLPNLHYHRRCEKTEPVVSQMIRVSARRRGCSDPVIACLRDVREQLLRQTRHLPHNPVKRLEARNLEFQNLRAILRPHSMDENGRKAPLNWGMLADDAPPPVDIAERLEQFQNKASRMANRKSLSASDRKMWKSVHRKMQRHSQKLDPVLNVRGRQILLPRTNNLSETGFRDFKRRLRRTTGNGDLSRQLDLTPAQVFYTENLRCPDYTRIVFENRPMAEALADVEPSAVRKTVETMKTPPAPGIIDHEFINRPDFHAALQARFAKIIAQKSS